MQVSGEIIEGRVVLCDSEHNLHIDLGIINGIIPRCEGAIGIEDASVRDIALISRVNKFVAFKIKAVEYDEAQMPYAVLSRRDVQLECKKTMRLASFDIFDTTLLRRCGRPEAVWNAGWMSWTYWCGLTLIIPPVNGSLQRHYCAGMPACSNAAVG